METNYLKEQELRTRVLYLESAAMRLLQDGDRKPLERAMSNDWAKTIGEVMEDPFATIKLLAHKRDQVKHEWSQEVKALHAAGFSLRAIASAAGVSHDTVWKKVRV